MSTAVRILCKLYRLDPSELIRKGVAPVDIRRVVVTASPALLPAYRIWNIVSIDSTLRVRGISDSASQRILATACNLFQPI